MSTPFGQYASLKKAGDGYQQSQYSAIVYKDQMVIWDNHSKLKDNRYWTSDYTPVVGREWQPLVWKKESDDKWVVTQKFVFLKTDQEDRFVFTKVNGEWEFSFMNDEFTMRRNLPAGLVAWNPFAGFWKVVIEAYMALTGARYRIID